MWSHLVRTSLASAPARIAELDAKTLAALRRFAGRRVLVALPEALPWQHLFGFDGKDAFLLLEFAGDGTPSCRPVAKDESADLRLRLSIRGPVVQDGDRRLALRLLVVLRRYRPDLEAAFELWFGAEAAAMAAMLLEPLYRLGAGRRRASA